MSRSLVILGISSIFASSVVMSSEDQDKHQRQYDILVEGCICDWLELEANNNTYLSYSRIVTGCNGLVADKILPKRFKAKPFGPKLNQVACKESVSNWLESKQE